MNNFYLFTRCRSHRCVCLPPGESNFYSVHKPELTWPSQFHFPSSAFILLYSHRMLSPAFPKLISHPATWLPYLFLKQLHRLLGKPHSLTARSYQPSLHQCAFRHSPMLISLVSITPWNPKQLSVHKIFQTTKHSKSSLVPQWLLSCSHRC